MSLHLVKMGVRGLWSFSSRVIGPRLAGAIVSDIDTDAVIAIVPRNERTQEEAMELAGQIVLEHNALVVEREIA